MESDVLCQTGQEMNATNNSTVAGYEYPYPRRPSSNNSNMKYGESLKLKYDWYKTFPVF